MFEMIKYHNISNNCPNWKEHKINVLFPGKCLTGYTPLSIFDGAPTHMFENDNV